MSGYQISYGAYCRGIRLADELRKLPCWMITAMYDTASYQMAGKLQGDEAQLKQVYELFREIDLGMLEEISGLMRQMERNGDLQVIRTIADEEIVKVDQAILADSSPVTLVTDLNIREKPIAPVQQREVDLDAGVRLGKEGTGNFN